MLNYIPCPKGNFFFLGTAERLRKRPAMSACGKKISARGHNA